MKNILRSGVIAFILLSSCARQDPSNASIVLNPIQTRQEVPTVVVQTSKGQQRLEPSVWNASAKQFGDLPPATITVKRGQTLYTISRQHMVPLRTLIDRNHLSAPFAVKPGQKLIVDRPRVHVAARGETLRSIAQLHNVDVYSLAQMNGLTAPFVIEAGQPLVLPSRIMDVKLPPPRPMIEAPMEKPQAGKRVEKRQPMKMEPAIPPGKAKPAMTLHAKESRSGFRAPVEGKIIQEFGRQSGGIQNDGVNVSAPLGTPVKAADHGVVAYVGRDIPSFGKLILVKHQDGWISAYAHVDKVAVQRGQQLRQGDILARVGKTGNVTEPQLHFELRQGRKPVDPRKYVRF